ncbi:HAMP domain-containing histidine kinase [Desulfosporosinus fructosivorans]|uniref:histidine kinase n=1 Tax=Desulfosporosinus fructosivorans TaxID=2018669 RepID=A0A4Z0R7I9_9FIRM|nr:HAMP domain-containing sensor histidine kinase [Desulfosporosinus fructosivorans]TGE39151.1 HAMP domain-containing histidine kinase [Desulfosporosinus fructosivorans]
MKFWQKAFLCIIIVFLIGFDVATYLLVQKSYTLNTGNVYATAQNERYIIQKSLYDRISDISDLYTELNPDNLKMYINPYGDYYKNQNIYMELYRDDTLVYSNFNQASDERPELNIDPDEKSTVARVIDNVSYLFVTGYLDEPYSNLKFVYIKDIQDLTDYKHEMIRYAVMISIIVSLFLSVLIIGMLLKLTRPIRKLNKTAEEIANGHYQKRVEVKSRDEIGEFAHNFNAMADSVEVHIQKLFDLTEERQRFINNLAHEMRTPITAIMGYGEFLKCANCSPEESVKALDYIIQQSERMKNMTAKLMDLACLNNGNIKFETVNFQEILENIEQTLSQNIEKKKIHIKKDLQRTELQGDKDLLESLILNIMENAVRALPVGGEIEVKTYGDENELILSIADNGIGMKEGELGKVLEPFYRVDKSRSRVNGGAGLGLALSKQICDLHHAEMNMSSKPEMGTKVEIKFTTLLQSDDNSEI